jgi:predicted  nucleic acid-binding Zn-ribbon protein
LRQLIQKLMELQKIDSQLQQLESLKGDLPNQVRRLNQELMEAEKSLETHEKKTVDNKKEVGIIEMEIKALEGKQQKYQNQLFEVKTNREYDAVTHEIESVKIEIGKKESRLLELMDLVENGGKFIEESRNQMTRLKGEYEKKNNDLNKKQEATERDEIALKDKRDKALRNIDSKSIAAYERIRNAKNGLAMVPVVLNACSGCHKKLPPQRVLEIREGDRLYMCDVCGRMLVWDDSISDRTE